MKEERNCVTPQAQLNNFALFGKNKKKKCFDVDLKATIHQLVFNFKNLIIIKKKTDFHVYYCNKFYF